MSTGTANEVRGELRVTVGGHELILVPSFQRLAKLESALGRSIVQFAMDLGRTQAVSFQDIVLILDITAKNPKPSTDAIGDAVVQEGIMTVLPKLSQFLEQVLTGGSDDNPPAQGDE